jgi:hypothetical protein
MCQCRISCSWPSTVAATVDGDNPRQITEAFPWDTAPKYLIRNIDPAFGGAFKARIRVYPV